ncbi:hypothetical protein [Streptosporangium sp. NPDC051022]|uniref:hypothetical protein n=1 Tax=Streptosporangium sp. NPDC051022 TaxID=3155752 RepID=UPI00341E0AF6
MSIGVRITRLFTVGALSAMALAAAPIGSANAAAYTPEGVCGSGFSRVSDGTRAVKEVHTGEVLGYVYLLYNNGTGYNCLATIKTKYVGVATTVTAILGIQGGDGGYDSDEYKYFAKAVAYGKGKCASIWGGIHGTSSSVYGEGVRGYGNCG